MQKPKSPEKQRKLKAAKSRIHIKKPKRQEAKKPKARKQNEKTNKKKLRDFLLGDPLLLEPHLKMQGNMHPCPVELLVSSPRLLEEIRCLLEGPPQTPNSQNCFLLGTLLRCGGQHACATTANTLCADTGYSKGHSCALTGKTLVPKINTFVRQQKRWARLCANNEQSYAPTVKTLNTVVRRR